MSRSESTFSGNVLKLVTGGVFAQGLGVLVTPVVTRLFAPEAFGVAALFLSITSIIGVVACLRYELSIMLPKTDEEAANLLGVSLFFVLIISGISALIILFAESVIVNSLNSPDLKKYIWLIPVSVFVSGVFLVLNYWNSRTKNFGRLSIARVISSVATQTVKLGAGFSGFVSGGVLIGASVLGQVISAIILGGQIWREDRSLFKKNIRWAKMVSGLKRHKKFPVYGTWSALLNTASHQIPALILAFYFSPKIVGFYALGMMVLSVPMNLVGGAVAQVFFQKASEVYNTTGNISEVVKEVFDRLVSFGIFPILLLMLLGEEVFVMTFGARWAEAGVYMQILSLWIFFQFISSPISTLFAILEKQHYGLLFNSLLFTIRSASLIIGGIIGNVIFALFLFGCIGVLFYAFLCFWLMSKARVTINHSLYQIMKCTLYGMPMLIIVALLKWSFEISEICILITALFAIILYYLFMIWQDEKFRKSLVALLSPS